MVSQITRHDSCVSNGERSNNRKPDPELLGRFAINLKRLRIARGYSQKELARRSGFGNCYISKCEREKINVTLAGIGTFAHALECSEQDFFLPIRALAESDALV